MEAEAIGLAHRVRLKHAVARDEKIRWSDVDIDLTSQAVTSLLMNELTGDEE